MSDQSAEQRVNALIEGKFVKLDAEKRIAYGWFSVVEMGNNPVVDSQGDIIDEATLVDAVHRFMQESRAGKFMHNGPRRASVVESIVLTKNVQDALGIDLGMVGWFGGMQFHDEELWAQVKSGGFNAFSIGGWGNRQDA